MTTAEGLGDRGYTHPVLPLAGCAYATSAPVPQRPRGRLFHSHTQLVTRVVVTGLGAVTPLGNDAPSTWKALIAGCSGIGPITRFDASAFEVAIAAEVRNFDPDAWLPTRERRHM